MNSEIVDLLKDFIDNAEVDGAENLYLARHEEGYVGDPKEFRFSEIFARRLPTYKHERIVEYIDEARRLPPPRLRRRLTDKEADWLLREVGKIKEEEQAHIAKALPMPNVSKKKKRAKQLDAEIAETLARRKS